MADIDLGKLMADIVAAASGIAKKDITALTGFSRTQLQAMAKQAAWIAAARAAGELDDDLFTFFTENLARTAKNFVTVITGLATVMMEKVWNAVVGVLWGAIEGAAGSVIPLPKWK